MATDLKIVVVGPLPRQQGEIRKAFPGVRVKFVKMDYRQVSGGAFVVVWTKYCGHSHVEQAQRFYRRDRIFRYGGGLQGLLEHIGKCIREHNQKRMKGGEQP